MYFEKRSKVILVEQAAFHSATFINSLNDLSLDKKLLNAWFENRLRLEIVHASDLSLSFE